MQWSRFLGVFVDQFSMMLITLPIFVPLVTRLGIDPIWFGSDLQQLGVLLPPHRLLLRSCGEWLPATAYILQAVVPYLFLGIALIALLLQFPTIATWLPTLLVG